MEFPEYLHGRLNELISIEQEAAKQRQFMVVALGLKPFIDGDKWCFLWGENAQSGLTGFGDTVELAMWDFENNFYTQRLAPCSTRGRSEE